MDEFAQFYTKKSKDVKRIYINDVDGNKSEHWIDLLPSGSKQDRAGSTLYHMERQKIEAKRGDMTQTGYDYEIAMLATYHSLARAVCLTVGWSFKTECTKDNVKKFLENADHVLEQIENEVLFFELLGKNKEAQDFLSENESISKNTQNTSGKSQGKSAQKKRQSKTT